MSGTGYTPHTPAEIRQMLDAIGVAETDELFSAIPAGLRARSFDLPDGMSEFEMLRRMEGLAGLDRSDLVPFIGGGCYDHIIPSVVDHLAGRSEFATSYTPYQPECSQGTLQALYEYQTAVCRLTGMDATNASLYDGGTALAEAALMALRITGRHRIIMDGGVSPFAREIVRAYLANLDTEPLEVQPTEGLTDRDAILSHLDHGTAAIVVQNPSFFGTVDDFSDLAAAAHACGALLIVSAYPVSLGMLKSPGEMGADLAVADGQAWGTPFRSAAPPSASWRCVTNTSGTCRDGSWGRPLTGRGGAASCLPSRHASSTYAGTGPPPTSAATRACAPCAA